MQYLTINRLSRKEKTIRIETISNAMGKLKIPKSKDKRLEKIHRSQAQEAACADRLGGAVVKGSGCGAEKGDVRLPTLVRVECKSTLKQSFSVTREMMEKIERTALAAGEIPALEVELAQEPKLRVVVVPVHALKLIIDLK